MRKLGFVFAGMVFCALSIAQDRDVIIDRFLQAQMDTFHIPALSAAIGKWHG